MGMLYEYDSVERDIIDHAAQKLAKDIDREILWGMLIGIGWTKVQISDLQISQFSLDIRQWLNVNCKHHYQQNGKDFIFENDKEAMWFSIRWLG